MSLVQISSDIFTEHFISKSIIIFNYEHIQWDQWSKIFCSLGAAACCGIEASKATSLLPNSTNSSLWMTVLRIWIVAFVTAWFFPAIANQSSRYSTFVTDFRKWIVTLNATSSVTAWTHNFIVDAALCIWVVASESTFYVSVFTNCFTFWKIKQELVAVHNVMNLDTEFFTERNDSLTSIRNPMNQ